MPMTALSERKKRLLSKESLVILLALLVVVCLTISMVIFTRDENFDVEENENISNLTEEEYKQATTFDKTSIVDYASLDNCWIIYKDGVYELTSILNKVPEVKSGGCGKEYSKEFSRNSAQAISPYLVAYTRE